MLSFSILDTERKAQEPENQPRLSLKLQNSKKRTLIWPRKNVRKRGRRSCPRTTIPMLILIPKDGFRDENVRDTVARGKSVARVKNSRGLKERPQVKLTIMIILKSPILEKEPFLKVLRFKICLKVQDNSTESLNIRNKKEAKNDFKINN